MIWKDKKLVSFTALPISVMIEHERQIEKWGIQERTPFEWLCYLTEEVGELNEAVSEYVYRHGTTGEIHNEAIQIATLALKIAEMAQAPLTFDEAKP